VSTLDALTVQEALALVPRIDPKYHAVWEGRPAAEQAALANYFLPHRSAKPMIGPTRPRVVKWYCPFGHQHSFPSGHRYCINVYTGCAHGCAYCYAAAYEPEAANSKSDFERLIDKDMADLERFDVPPAPGHMSNSTDALQPMEERLGHCRYALERIRAHRRRFSTITLLTKNPLLAAKLGYIGLFKELSVLPPGHPRAAEFQAKGWPAFQVEVTLEFWRDEARAFYAPGAPSVQERIEGIRALRAAGIAVVLRIDPLFPRSPLPTVPAKGMADFGLCEAQTLDDLDRLVAFAGEVGVRHVVFSLVKIVKRRRGHAPEAMEALLRLYRALSPSGQPVWRGGSWRLPETVARAHVVEPFLGICGQHGVQAKFCMHNLIETP